MATLDIADKIRQRNLGRVLSNIDESKRNFASDLTRGLTKTPSRIAGNIYQGVNTIRKSVVPSVLTGYQAQRNLQQALDTRNLQLSGDYKTAGQNLRTNTNSRTFTNTQRTLDPIGVSQGYEASQKNFNDIARKSAGAGGEALLYASGLAAGAPALVGGAVIGGALGGGINAVTGENIAEGIGEGIGNAPKYVGLNRLFNPYLNTLAEGILPQGASTLSRVGARAVSTGLSNVAEDVLNTGFQEQRLPTGKEATYSFLLGLVSDSIASAAQIKKTGKLSKATNDLFEITKDGIKVKEQARDAIGRFAKDNNIDIKKAETELRNFGDWYNNKIKVRKINGDIVEIPRGQAGFLGFGQKPIVEDVSPLDRLQPDGMPSKSVLDQGVTTIDQNGNPVFKPSSQVDTSGLQRMQPTPAGDPLVSGIKQVPENPMAGMQPTPQQQASIRQNVASQPQTIDEIVRQGFKEQGMDLVTASDDALNARDFNKARQIVEQMKLDPKYIDMLDGGQQTVKNVFGQDVPVPPEGQAGFVRLGNEQGTKGFEQEIEEYNRQIQRGVPVEDPRPLTDITSPEEQKLKISTIQQKKQLQKMAEQNIQPGLPTSQSVDNSSFDESISRLPDLTSDNVLKHKVNMLDYFRTPDKVLEKIGLGQEAKDLRQAHQNYVQRLPKEIDKVTQWWDQVGRNENSSKRIFRYLDGQKQDLTPVEKKVAKEMKSYLKNWADELGLPEDKRIASYITHIFDDSLLQKEFDPELAKIIDDKIPGSVYDPFLEKRLGKLGYKEDAFAALDAYVKRATRKVAMDPALQQLKSNAEDLPLESWKYIKNYTDKINMRPSDTDSLIDNLVKQSPIGYGLGQRPTAKVTRFVRRNTYRATLGLNAGSALRNLTQGANTYAELGEVNTARGYFDATKAILTGDTELKDVGVLADNFIQDRNLSAKKQLLKKLDEGLWAMFNMAEKINRGAAYYGGKSRALNQGKNLQQAIQEGIDTARKTQFTFGAVDTPVALQSDLSKTLLQFQSFNIKQAEFLGEMIKDKNVAGMVRYLAAWTAFAYLGKNLLGLKVQDAIPFSSEIFEGKTRIGSTPPLQLVTGTYKALAKAPGRYGEDAQETLMGRLGQQGVFNSLGASTIPGFVQGKKTYEGIKSATQGYSESSGGRVRTPVDQTARNLIAGALFGQYSNEQVRKYFDENRSVLGESQTKTFKQVLQQNGMEAAKKYYDSIIEEREIKRNLKEIKEGRSVELDKNKLTTTQARDLIKTQIEAGIDVSEQDLYSAYLYKPLTMPSSNRYEKGERDSSLYSASTTILNDETLSDSQKTTLINKVAEQLNKSPEDVRRYQIAKEDNSQKTLYALDQFDTFQSNDEVMRFLVNGRKPINNKILVSDGVIDNLVRDGLIPTELGKQLKDLDLNEDGSLKKKASTKKRSSTKSKTNTAVKNYLNNLAKIKLSSSQVAYEPVSLGDVSNLTLTG